MLLHVSDEEQSLELSSIFTGPTFELTSGHQATNRLIHLVFVDALNRKRAK